MMEDVVVTYLPLDHSLLVFLLLVLHIYFTQKQGVTK